MSTPHTVVAVSARIAAPAERVYAIIANYRESHARILPKEFSGLTVEQGGIGAGTIIRFQMRAFGTMRTYRAAVTEPEPGRVLVETNLEGNDAVSTFTVNRGSNPAESEVTISTELRIRPGLLGKLERALMTGYLRPIYERELALLAACVESAA